MFGTDWSTTWRWLSVPASLHKIRLKVLEEAKLSKAESELILWKNAAKLFKLDAQISAPAPGVNA
jgi:predicted TIM-barrel fold metal-dependent hydrolase